MEQIRRTENSRNGIRILLAKTLKEIHKELGIPVMLESFVQEMQKFEVMFWQAENPKQCEKIHFSLKELWLDLQRMVGKTENPKHQKIAVRLMATAEILLIKTTSRIRELNQLYHSCTPTNVGEDDFIFCHRESQTS